MLPTKIQPNVLWVFFFLLFKFRKMFQRTCGKVVSMRTKWKKNHHQIVNFYGDHSIYIWKCRAKDLYYTAHCPYSSRSNNWLISFLSIMYWRGCNSTETHLYFLKLRRYIWWSIQKWDWLYLHCNFSCIEHLTHFCWKHFNMLALLSHFFWNLSSSIFFLIFFLSTQHFSNIGSYTQNQL